MKEALKPRTREQSEPGWRASRAPREGGPGARRGDGVPFVE
jgi:hypothetical protein